VSQPIVRVAGKELGARYVMEGSIRQVDEAAPRGATRGRKPPAASLGGDLRAAYSPEAVFELQDELVPRIVSPLLINTAFSRAA